MDKQSKRLQHLLSDHKNQSRAAADTSIWRSNHHKPQQPPVGSVVNRALGKQTLATLKQSTTVATTVNIVSHIIYQAR